MNDNNYYTQPNNSINNDSLNQNQVNNGMQFPSQQKTSKKNNNILIIVPILLVIFLVGFLSWYLLIFKNPVSVYRSYIKKGINEVFSIVNKNDDKYESGIKIGANVKVNNDMIDESILDLINNISLNFNFQTDKKSQQLVYKLESKYKEDSLLNISAFVDSKDKKSYVYLKDYLDKYIEMDLEEYTSFAKLLEDETFAQKVNKNTVKEILIKEISNVITKENATKENDVYILKFTEKELVEKTKTIINNLKNNQKYLNCFENPDEVKSNLEDSIENLNNIEIGDKTLTYKVYKKGLMQKVTKVEVIYDDMILSFDIDGKVINYTLTQSGEKVLDGSINITGEKNNKKIGLTLNIPEVGSITLNFELTYVKGKDIDKIDSSKITKELTDEDKEEIMSKLQDSKLYELITSFSNNYDDSDFNIDFDDSNDYGDDNYDFSDITSSSNQISTSNGKTINFEVPSSYENYYNNNTYKSFKNDNTDITVKVINYYDDEDDYLNTLDSKVTYAKKDKYYGNVNLSNKKTMDVNGKTYYYKDYTYDYIGTTQNTKYYEKYLCAKLDNDNYYIVEVSSKNLEISSSDLNKFLSIK